MNGRELLEAMSYIDESLVAASEAAPKTIRWQRFVPLAACFAFLIAGSLLWGRFQGTFKSADQAAPMVLTEAAMEYCADMEVPAEAPAAPREPLEDAGSGLGGITTDQPASAENGASETGSSILVSLTVEFTRESAVLQSISESSSGLTPGMELILEYENGESVDQPDGIYRFQLISYDSETNIAIVAPLEN